MSAQSTAIEVLMIHTSQSMIHSSYLLFACMGFGYSCSHWHYLQQGSSCRWVTYSPCSGALWHAAL